MGMLSPKFNNRRGTEQPAADAKKPAASSFQSMFGGFLGNSRSTRTRTEKIVMTKDMRPESDKAQEIRSGAVYGGTQAKAST